MTVKFGNQAADTLLGAGFGDRLFGRGGDDLIFGYGGADLLFGGTGNDTLDGGRGADVLRAGTGNDTLIYTLSDNIGAKRPYDRYDGGKGSDTLRLNLTAAEWGNPTVKAEILQFMALVEAADGGPVSFRFTSLRLKVSSIEAVTLFVDGLPYTAEPAVIDLSGSTSDETVVVTSGPHLITTGTGNDTVVGGTGDDTINSGSGNDDIYLGDGNDVVRAGLGNDIIRAGAGGGDDLIDAGGGNDTVRYDSAVSGISVDLRLADRSTIALPVHPAGTVGGLLAANGYLASTPAALVTGADISVDVLIGVENIVGGAGNDTITGDDTDNRLDGAGGNDSIEGLAGLDALEGSSGNDTLNGGLDHDTLTGGSGDDSVNGGGGYDTIVLSGASTDYDVQTLGNGFYSITDTRANGDGVDVFTLVEELTFSDATLGLWRLVGRVQVYGDNAANVIEGTAARERFYGLDGDDSINGGFEEDEFVGGKGNDTLFGGGPEDDLNFVWDAVQYDKEYNQALDEGRVVSGVTVNLATGLATDVYGDTDTLIDIERVYGTKLGDLITGSGADEAFDPHGGDDTINGGDGWDSLHYHLTDGYYDGGTGGIVIQFSTTTAGSGTTLIDPLGDTDQFTGIEVVRGTRYVDQFIGGLGTQEFRGYDGADTLDGGVDYDILSYRDDANYDGFSGIFFDLSILNSDGYAVVTDAFGKLDQVRNFEQIRGTGTADVMRGDAADNDFFGNAGADLMVGVGGADRLIGGLGDDTLEGGADDDDLFGDAGADVLTGGTGNDQMQGGADADQFVFTTGDGNDEIDDFELGIDSLVLNGGLTIGSLVESDVNGDGGLDTTVLMSSGDQVVLLHVSGVTDLTVLL